MSSSPSWFWLTVVGGGLSAVALCILKRCSRTPIKCASLRLMSGKTVLITGANCGLGKATALELAKRDARVILACRDLVKAKQAMDDIRQKTTKGELQIAKLDLSSMSSVKQFCTNINAQENRLDVLINNAAVMAHPFTITEDGLEINMAVNHFGNFLMTNLLLDLLKKSSPSRIVFVSSSLHKFGNINLKYLNSKHNNPYADSKLANIYFARELHLRLKGTGVSVHTLSPGMVNTELGRHRLSKVLKFCLQPLLGLLIKSPEEGCQTIVHCAISEKLDNVSGGYYANCEKSEWSEISQKNVPELYQISEKLTGL
ncbi:Retinol dehydrogenase 14 [Mizuhopecten yessoensis]|uniref:Retinol dehydrogenase 14 n=1 Tax=Mizuhopecten yessoensis TaxID=6573 RepID=A0A210QP13_MIZYE|nr:Retinol dehydrogenase 14 [Mizuhopecten yessoensis]